MVNDSADLGNIETTRWNVGLALLDSAAVRQRQVSALFLQRLDSLPPHVRFTVPAGVSPHLVSLEIFPPGVASMTRLRAGVSPPMTGDSGLSLSDILLVLPDSSHTVPAFEDAVSRAIPRSWVRTSESIGLYWELYGARAGDSVAVQLVARSESGESGWLRRLASSVLGSSASAATAVQWQAEVPTDKADSAPHSDGLVLDFSGLAPGLYRFELSITISDGRHALVTRAVEVRR